MALKKHLRLEDAIKTLKMEEKNLKELIKQIQTSDEQGLIRFHPSMLFLATTQICSK